MNTKSKERLVGGLILLCLAVIFIPPFYDGRNPFELDEDIDQAQRPHPPRFPEAAAMADQIANTGTGRIDEIERKVKADLPENARSDQQFEEEKNGLSATFSDLKTGEMTSKLLSDIAENSQLMARFSKDKRLKQAWAVQVASFQEVERAQAVRDQLIQLGFQAYIKTVLKDGVSISRVFAGVSLDKAIAEEIKVDLDKKLGSNDAIIVPYQP